MYSNVYDDVTDFHAYDSPKIQKPKYLAIEILFSSWKKISFITNQGFLGNGLLNKQPSRGVPIKKRSENMQQIYRRTPMTKYIILSFMLFRQ